MDRESIHTKAGQLQDIDDKGRSHYVQSAAEKSLVRKLDYIYVMPFIAVLNFLQFFDKSAINYASQLGIMQDTHIDADQLGWLGSIFYLGYLLYQPINAYCLQRVPLSKYIGGLIVLWGLVLTVTCEAKNFSQLAALRFLLGFFEAGIYPCCVMLISTLYRRKEQAGRLGAVYICNGIALSVGGLVGYGIGHMNNVLGKDPWQWIMIILGAVTMLFGIICFFGLVDTPKSRFLRLTKEQEAIVDERMRDNAVVRTEVIKRNQIMESLREPRFYLFILASFLINLQNGALNTFSSIIINGFGFANLDAILLNIPSGAVDCVYIVAAVLINRYYGYTLVTACGLLCFTILGLILLLVIPLAQAKIVGLYLCWAYAASYTLLLVSVANNVSGYTKKAFYSSCITVLYTIGNFVGPKMMVQSQAPLYIGGMVGYIVADALCIACLLGAHWFMARSNRQRLANPQPNAAMFEDMTDQEDPNFIYRL
ncbi:major facilitator superfamily domain-containing protein [Radiomyces spectabilis]|uniref:major facilitator superfamily domain-containing protein n=1 Tax=Radiomyces spectabilis TaxID=64574 RepID=UPI00221EA8C5|nr:major facilitator superfamily domain-containing protein [Radiomyces spectabilis]KAI8393773.1 major facilitator superfamily domain-containing protein [Radiomyces spectabilis]